MDNEDEVNPDQDEQADMADEPSPAGPAVPDKIDPRDRLSQYLKTQIERNQRMNSPEVRGSLRDDRTALADTQANNSLTGLILNSASKFGAVGGKTPQSNYDDFAQNLNKQTQNYANDITASEKEGQGAEDKNLKLYDYLAKSNEVQKANDPNSSAANQARQMLKATYLQRSKEAQQVGDQATADQLAQMSQTAGEGMTADAILKMHNQLKDLSYDGLIRAKILQDTRSQSAQDRRQAAQDRADRLAAVDTERKEKAKRDELNKLGTDLMVNKASSRNAIGTAANKMAGAERLFSFAEVSPQEMEDALQNPAKKAQLVQRLDQMTPQQKAEIVSGLMSQVVPGSVSLGQFEHLNAPTAEERFANLKQYFMSDPSGAKAGDLIFKNLQSINNEYKTSKSQIGRHFNSVKAGHRSAFQTYPEDAQAMLDDFIKQLADNDSTIASNMDGSGSAPSGGQPSGTATAAPGGGKQVIKKQYSPSRNQTKIIYSDGSEEAKDGR